MRKPKAAKGMKLISKTKRLPKKLTKCLRSKGPSALMSTRGKWTMAWNHDTQRFEVWAKPGAAGKCVSRSK